MIKRISDPLYPSELMRSGNSRKIAGITCDIKQF